MLCCVWVLAFFAYVCSLDMGREGGGKIASSRYSHTLYVLGMKYCYCGCHVQYVDMLYMHAQCVSTCVCMFDVQYTVHTTYTVHTLYIHVCTCMQCDGCTGGSFHCTLVCLWIYCTCRRSLSQSITSTRALWLT